MPTCPKCPKPNKRNLLFAFLNGKIVYGCTRHISLLPKDAVTDWIRVGKWVRAKDA